MTIFADSCRLHRTLLQGEGFLLTVDLFHEADRQLAKGQNQA